MKKISLGWIILFLVLFIFLSSSIFSQTGDSFFLDSEKVILLRGNWKFIGKDIKNAENKDFDDSDWGVLPVPRLWRSLGLLGTRVAWYRTKIFVPKSFKDKDLGIQVPAVFQAYELFWNGEQIGQEGVLSKSGEVLKAVVRINYFKIDSQKIELGAWNTLALRMGDKNKFGGIATEFHIGEYSKVKENFLSYFSRKFAVSGFIFFLGIYYFLYSFHVNDRKLYLLFAIVLCNAGMFFLAAERIFSWIIDSFAMHFFALEFPVCVNNFLYHILTIFYFKARIQKLDVVLFIISGIFLFSALLITFHEPLLQYRNQYFIHYLVIWSIILIFRIIHLVVSNFKRSKLQSKTIVVAIIFLILYSIYYIYLVYYRASNENLLSEGFLLFALIMALVISEKEGEGQKELLEFQTNYSKKLESEVLEKTKELDQLNHTKDKIFSILSHDLRSPIDALSGMIHLFNSKSIEGEQLKKHLAGLSVTLEHNKYILNNLLNWSTSQIQEFKPIYKQMELNSLIEEVISMIYNSAHAKEIKIHFTPETPVIVKADLNLVRIVLINLLNNSIKFSERNTQVKVELKKKKSLVLVSIIDEGIGLPKGIEELFLIQTSGGRRGTENEKGLGIGLMLCKDFLEKAGETITAKNNPKKGCKFTFTLKRVQ